MGVRIWARCQGLADYCSNHNPLDLIERNLVAAAVVKHRCLWAFMVGDVLGFFDSAAVLAKDGDAGGPEGVVADAFRQASGLCPAFYHVECVAGVELAAGQRAVPVDAAEEGAFL